MRQLAIQIRPWDQILSATVNDSLFECLGSVVMIETEGVSDIAHVITGEINHEHLKTATVLRGATADDLQQLQSRQHEANEYLEYCRNEAQRLQLPMKLIAAHVSLDSQRILIGFTATTRIDFRELVKRLHQHFPKSIRLQQVNPRDQLRICGNIGICGRELCCQGLLKYRRLGLVDANASCNRCTDKPNGACGRTKCCSVFEKDPVTMISHEKSL